MRAAPGPARTGKGRRHSNVDCAPKTDVSDWTVSAALALQLNTQVSHCLARQRCWCLEPAAGPPQLGAETSLQHRAFSAESAAANILQPLSTKRNLCPWAYGEGLEETPSTLKNQPFTSVLDLNIAYSIPNIVIEVLTWTAARGCFRSGFCFSSIQGTRNNQKW